MTVRMRSMLSVKRSQAPILDGSIPSHSPRDYPRHITITTGSTPEEFMAYGPHFPSLYRRAAEIVNKILRGMKPANIPVEQPTRYDLVINLTTAKALQLKIPKSLLARADKLIE